jgi:phage N-6-adenine-methyltransferase
VKNPQLFTSARGDWETPWEVIRACEELCGPFDLDVCARDGNVAKAPAYFTPEQDGLKRTWAGVCWCNPPYGRGLEAWVERAARAAEDGALVCMLLPARTDTRWFHEYAPRAEVRLLKGRIRFELDGKPGDAATFPSMLLIFGRTRARGTITTYALPTASDFEAEEDLQGIATREREGQGDGDKG